MVGRLGLPEPRALPGALALTLVLAALVGSLAAWAGWQTAEPLPSDEQAVAAAARAVPDQAGYELRRRDALFVYDYAGDGGVERAVRAVVGDDDYVPGYVEVTLPDRGNGPAGGWGRLAANFRADGWTVDRLPYSDDLVATRDDQVATVTSEVRYDDAGEAQGRSHDDLVIRVHRTEPASVPWLTAAGALLGAVVGWLLAGWGYRRMRSRGPAARKAALLSRAGLLLLLPVTLVVLIEMVRVPLLSGVQLPQPAWDPYMLVFLRVPALLGAVALLAAAALLAGPDRAAARVSVR
ncbi:hypothetical protein [Micromonospora mirobrigensis]|nr:hypothetical protein [Micromonospora mirobrigensis]